MADPVQDLNNSIDLLQQHPYYSQLPPDQRAAFEKLLADKGLGHKAVVPPTQGISPSFLGQAASRFGEQLNPHLGELWDTATKGPTVAPINLAMGLAKGLWQQIMHGAPIQAQSGQPAEGPQTLSHIPVLGQPMGQLAQDIRDSNRGAETGDVLAGLAQIFGPDAIKALGQSFGPAEAIDKYTRTLGGPPARQEGNLAQAAMPPERFQAAAQDLFNNQVMRKQDVPGYLAESQLHTIDTMIKGYRDDAKMKLLTADPEKIITFQQAIDGAQKHIAEIASQFPSQVSPAQDKLAEWLENQSGIEKLKAQPASKLIDTAGKPVVPAQAAESSADYIDRVQAMGYGKKAVDWIDDKNALRHMANEASLAQSTGEVTQGANATSPLYNLLQRSLDKAQAELFPDVKKANLKASDLITMKDQLTHLALTQPSAMMRALPIVMGLPATMVASAMGMRFGQMAIGFGASAVTAAGAALLAFRDAIRSPVGMERLAFALNNLGKGPVTQGVGMFPRVGLVTRGLSNGQQPQAQGTQVPPQ